MTEIALKTADIIAIKRESNSISNQLGNITAIMKELKSSGRDAELAAYLKGVNAISESGGSKAELINGEVIFVDDLIEPSPTDEKDVDEYTYGVVLEFNGLPFVVYPDGPQLVLEPYSKLSIAGVYRHFLMERDAQRSQLIYNFIMPDLAASLSGDSCNINVASKFPGNIGLNYLLIVFGFLGMQYPDEWVETGAPRAIVEDFEHGCRKVMA